MYDYAVRCDFVDAKCKMKCYGSTTVGERGQIVLPVEARKLFEIEPGDKLIVMGVNKGFQSVVLMKSEAVTKMFEHMLDVEKTIKEGGKSLEKMQKESLKGIDNVLKERGFIGRKKKAEKAKGKKAIRKK